VKVVVCLHAARAAVGEPAAVGVDDALALTLALGLGAGHSVTALLAGTVADEGPLARALAAGATRAVRVVGEDFGAADFHTLGQALATAVKRIGGADLVLCGARSDDDGLGAVPASLARNVGAGTLFVACVETLAAAADGVEVSVRGGGLRRRLRVPTPAVLSVVSSGAAPALPETAGAAPAIEVISLVDPEATVVRRRTELLGQPELPQRKTEVVTSADALVAALARG
jgi:electron transfer flavoprotein alpha/beta subunit